MTIFKIVTQEEVEKPEENVIEWMLVEQDGGSFVTLKARKKGEDLWYYILSIATDVGRIHRYTSISLAGLDTTREGIVKLEGEEK